MMLATYTSPARWEYKILVEDRDGEQDWQSSQPVRSRRGRENGKKFLVGEIERKVLIVLALFVKALERSDSEFTSMALFYSMFSIFSYWEGA